MPLIDILQDKKKLKYPYIRRWYHGKGDDTYRQVKATKTKLSKLAGHVKTKKGKKQDWAVAFKGKEYHVAEFLRKHPSYKLKSKRKRKK